MMQSCWVLYTAFPMGRKGTDPHLEDSALGVSFEQQSDEASEYNSTMPGNDGAVVLVEDEVGEGGQMALVSVGGVLAQMPRQAAVMLVNSGLSAADVLEMLHHAQEAEAAEAEEATAAAAAAEAAAVVVVEEEEEGIPPR
eukprot:COSAG01_NODE_2834_length_6995_cov_5.819751_9_plen_140_part_00